MVKCRLCNHEAKLLARHIISTHGITTREYKERFPDSEISTQEFKDAQKNKDLTNLHKSVSDRLKKDWENPEYREKMRIIQSNSLKRRLGLIS